MGTINYGTSDYITIGYNCDNAFFRDDWDGYDRAIMLEKEHDDIKYVLSLYDFYYFHVTIEPGYYDGFYINIENNTKYCFDTYADKRAAQKEITQLKYFLWDCVDYGLCAVSPGWCTTYYGPADTLTKISDAIKEMRADVRSTPTWATLPANEKYAY